jgi:hypothetical protein
MTITAQDLKAFAARHGIHYTDCIRQYDANNVPHTFHNVVYINGTDDESYFILTVRDGQAYRVDDPSNIHGPLTAVSDLTSVNPRSALPPRVGRSVRHNPKPR